MHKSQDPSTKKAKRDKSLALKVSETEIPGLDRHMAYLTQRFQEIVRKHGDFTKKGNLDMVVNSNVKYGGDKDKRKDQVRDKSSRKAVVDYGVKKALKIWEIP